MTRRLTLLATLATLSLLVACGGGGGDEGTDDTGQSSFQQLTSLESGRQEASYALGVDMGRQVAGMPGTGDHDQVLLGMNDRLADQPKLDELQCREIMSVQGHDHAEGETPDHEDTWTANGFASEEAQRSYALGVSLGQFGSSQLADIDHAALTQGLSDKLGAKELLCDETKAREIFTAYQKEAMDKVANENLAKGQAWLAENAKRDGVIITDSGLQYEIIEEGDGVVHPEATNTVKVHYHGTLTDGTVFDSSVDRGEPISFPLNRVIKGWTEGVQLMTVGSKYKFFIPTELAYGTQVRPGSPIGPNDALIFDVELIEIQ